MSIQQRLLQREPLDPWSVREQLCLASAVCRSGDQNWMSVSRALRAAGDPTRPQDWYQQKYCAAQYGALLEGAETPKRKKRTSEGGVETPQDAILKKLTAERIAELQKLMQDYKSQYAVLKEEISEVRSPSTSEARMREISAAAEASRRQREREQQRHAQWLRDREERRRNADKTRRASLGTAGGLSPPASSPLLTSLLKSTSPGGPGASVSQMLHIPHPSTVIDPVSPSASAPTLSMLLEKGREPPPPRPVPNDAAVIEQIKSELQEIEHSLRMGNMPPSTPPVLPLPLPTADKTPSVDIDDIEIKAEDVYAFSDMDLDIQPVSTLHKTLGRSIDKPSPDKKEDLESDIVEVEALDSIPAQAETLEIKEELVEMAAETEAAVAVNQSATPTPDLGIEDAIVIEPEVSAETPELPPTELESVVSERDDTAANVVTADSTLTADIFDESATIETEEEVNVTGVSESDVADASEHSQSAPSVDERRATRDQTPAEEPIEEEHLVDEVKTETEAVLEESSTSPVHANEDERWEGRAAGAAEPAEAEGEREGKTTEPEEVHTETDDDTPMEVIREEEKGGRKRRDYSRRKTQVPSESRGCSGSESAAESAPPSPAPPPRAAAPPAPADPDREHRLWKKSVMLVYNRLCAHKYASLFLRPITDDLAPDYSLVVRRPMDLTTIKRNIDSGVIRTTAEFQRDVLLMLSNALLYNSSRHRVHQMAHEMHQEAVAQLGMLLQAQAHAALSESHAEPVSRRAHAGGDRKRGGSPRPLGSPAPKRLRKD